MDARHDEKIEALEELADVITDVEDADVFVTAIWLGTDAHTCLDLISVFVMLTSYTQFPVLDA